MTLDEIARRHAKEWEPAIAERCPSLNHAFLAALRELREELASWYCTDGFYLDDDDVADAIRRFGESDG